MAVTGVTQKKPVVVELGGAYEETTLLAGSADTITEGDLIRINTSGTVDLADASSATGGAVHGIALEDGTAGSAIKLLLFADDTVFAMQTVDSLAPSSLSVGTSYTIEYSSGTQAVTSTTSNGVVTVVGFPQASQPWSIEYGGWALDKTSANDVVLLRVLQSKLDVKLAAAS